MQIAAKGFLAKGLIVFGVKNKFMPKVVHHLRRHGDVAIAALMINLKKLPEGMRHQLPVFELKLGSYFVQLIKQAGREHIAANIIRTGCFSEAVPH